MLRRKERVRVYFPFEERWYEKNSRLGPYKVALLQEAGGVAEDAGGAGGEEGEVGALRVGGFLGGPFKVGGRAVEDAFAVHDMEELAGDGGSWVDEADRAVVLKGGGTILAGACLHCDAGL